MSDVIYARVMNRIGSESEWIADNPIILDGEIALVRFGALIKFKVGDGLTAFNALTYNVFDPTNFGGLATAATDPGSPTSPIMFLLTPGTTYPYFKDSGGVAITVPVSISGNPVISAYGVVLGAVTSTIYNTTVISLVEYTKFTDIFKISPHTETPVSETINATPLSNDNPTQAPSKIYPQNTAIVRNSGAVEYYNHDEIYAFPANRSSTPTWASNNYMFVNWKTAAAGFSKDGILTEVKVGTIAFGASGSKIQAFVLRPISLGAGTFSLVSAIGEIPSEVSNTEWHVFRGLSVQVKAGDMIGIRGIAACPIFYTGFPASDNYTHIIAQFPGDTTLAALNGGIAAGNIVQAPQTGRVFQIQAYISDADPLASNVPGGNLKLDTAGNIPKRIGKAGDMPWKQKKLIWIGTSIPAQYGSTSYPVQVGAYLDAIMYNEAIGSSGICWDGTRALSLSATIAELTAAYPGYEYMSYQNKIIGRAADLFVFDHGHNDTQYMTGVISKIGSGVLSVTAGSKNVTGASTKFTSEVRSGDKVYNSSGIFIGYADVITSDIAFTIVANSPATYTAAAFSVLNMNRTTFFGASNYIIQKALEDNPTLKLFFLTPYNRYTYSGTQTAQMNLARKQIADLAHFYNSPCCDMALLAGVNINNFLTATIDGIHPTQATADRIALVAYKAISDSTTVPDRTDYLATVMKQESGIPPYVIIDPNGRVFAYATPEGWFRPGRYAPNSIPNEALNPLDGNNFILPNTIPYAQLNDYVKSLMAFKSDSLPPFVITDTNGRVFAYATAEGWFKPGRYALGSIPNEALADDINARFPAKSDIYPGFVWIDGNGKVFMYSTPEGWFRPGRYAPGSIPQEALAAFNINASIPKEILQPIDGIAGILAKTITQASILDGSLNQALFNIKFNALVQSITDKIEGLAVIKPYNTKTVLCLGDSTTNNTANYTDSMATLTGLAVTRKSKGGITVVQIVDGDGAGYAALTAADVTGKDFITYMGGFNSRNLLTGVKTDMYPTQNTHYGIYNYVVSKILALMVTAGNTTGKLVLIIPYNPGRNGYITQSGDDIYPVGSGQTFLNMINVMKDVANTYGISYVDLYHDSGISAANWTAITLNIPDPTSPNPTFNDNLHYNAQGATWCGRVVAAKINSLYRPY